MKQYMQPCPRGKWEKPVNHPMPPAVRSRYIHTDTHACIHIHIHLNILLLPTMPYHQNRFLIGLVKNLKMFNSILNSSLQMFICPLRLSGCSFKSSSIDPNWINRPPIGRSFYYRCILVTLGPISSFEYLLFVTCGRIVLWLTAFHCLLQDACCISNSWIVNYLLLYSLVTDDNEDPLY